MPIAPPPVYVDPGLFFKNALMSQQMGEQRESRDLRDKLLQGNALREQEQYNMTMKTAEKAAMRQKAKDLYSIFEFSGDEFSADQLSSAKNIITGLGLPPGIMSKVESGEINGKKFTELLGRLGGVKPKERPTTFKGAFLQKERTPEEMIAFGGKLKAAGRAPEKRQKVWDNIEKRNKFVLPSEIEADTERYGQTMTDIKKIGEARRTTINIDTKAAQAAKTKEATKTAEYETYLKKDPTAVDDSIKAAKERFDKFEWEAKSPDERKLEGLKILNERIKATFGEDVQYGRVNGVLGWWKPDKDGNPILIRTR